MLFFLGRKELIINKNSILFVILAGGQSKRFGGGYKTFQKIEEISIFDRIINFLKNRNLDVIINANSNYKQFNKKNIPVIKDIKKGFQGPLAGIHASMVWSTKNMLNKKWLFTIPSDTPFLPNDLLEKFLENYDNKSQIFIASSNNKIHPVVSMINLNLLKSIEEEIESNNRKIMEWVKKHKYRYIEFQVKDFDPFFNINTKFDLKQAEKLISNKIKK